MGMYDAEVRRLRETELQCPKCRTENVPGQPTKVHLKTGDRAHCDECHHEWKDDKER